MHGQDIGVDLIYPRLVIPEKNLKVKNRPIRTTLTGAKLRITPVKVTHELMRPLI